MTAAGLFHVRRLTTAEPPSRPGPGKRNPRAHPGLFGCRQFDGSSPSQTASLRVFDAGPSGGVQRFPILRHPLALVLPAFFTHAALHVRRCDAMPKIMTAGCRQRTPIQRSSSSWSSGVSP